jgi:hypothetical protein
MLMSQPGLNLNPLLVKERRLGIAGTRSQHLSPTHPIGDSGGNDSSNPTDGALIRAIVIVQFPRPNPA